ncbi:aldo/keto reductase [Alloacidobacterium dinghuense]|uniref:Aldo/keto reductase n=1 Tax=Alloacidobacterium dinghuense TaxID=2763107 RepID=A0A7G8BP73_9BACT|nr:aldo/keto reductase [Alloacidobacterium dinghuense]QNI34343.1 aldo/keto reductase [Alloacidobacterium dinghuense]
MSQFTRRDFLKTSIAAGTVASLGPLSLGATTRTATDMVTLGKSGMQVTRLAFGTGSSNGHVQAALGQQEFTRLVHYAYDRGIRFFETAEAYVTPAMLGEALKSFPRDSYQLMTKVTTNHTSDPQQRFDDLRRTSQTEYFDILLLHWQHTPDWVSESARWQDGILEAQSKKVIRARGASVHGLPALRQMPGNKWLEVAMIRMNHNGTRMDGPTWEDNNNPDHVSEVVEHVKQVHKEGMGVISMKLVGDGAFTRREDRQAAMRFAFQHAGVDCVTVGFKNTQEVDEAINNLNLALA